MANFIVGLTGGIGSGKTAVSDRFAKHGIKVVDADVISREVVEPGSTALNEIAAHFGQGILLPDGTLDRAQLRQKIFHSAEEKQWLEQLLHPLIATETLRQLDAADGPYVIYVSPLLVEGGQKAICDRLLVVDVSEATQLQRTMQRDNNDEAQVKRIIASQASREERLAQADDVIENSAGLAELLQQADALHSRYIALAAEKAAAKG
jgi:dephospho-CoA kinase